MNLTCTHGRVTADIKILNANTDKTSICYFTIADNYKVNGEDKADYISYVAFGKTAENIAKYASKGIELVIEGRLRTNVRNNNGTKIYELQAVVKSFKIAGYSKKNQASDFDEYNPPVNQNI